MSRRAHLTTNSPPPSSSDPMRKRREGPTMNIREASGRGRQPAVNAHPSSLRTDDLRQLKMRSTWSTAFEIDERHNDPFGQQPRAVAVGRGIGVLHRCGTSDRTERAVALDQVAIFLCGSFSGRVSLSMRESPSSIRFGRGPTMSHSGRRGKVIRRRCGRWRISGCGSSIGAGRVAPPITR